MPTSSITGDTRRRFQPLIPDPGTRGEQPSGRWGGGDEYVDPIARQPGEVPADFLARLRVTRRPKTSELYQRDVTVRSPLHEIANNGAGLSGDPGAIRTRDPQLRRLFGGSHKLPISIRDSEIVVRSRSAMKCQEMP
jgi:hypothetical protein